MSFSEISERSQGVQTSGNQDLSLTFQSNSDIR